MIRNVLLDLDDTILDFHKAEALALGKALSQLGIEPKESTLALYSEINASQWRLLEAGKLTRKQVLTRRFDLLFERLGSTCDSIEAQRCYECNLKVGHYFIDGAPELLEALYPNYDLYLVSNGNWTVQEGRLQSANISHYFKGIFISELIGYDKPRKEYFDCCFSKIPGFLKDETIIIGDTLTSDILGGINAGIHTCWFNPHHKPASDDIPAEYEVHALAEIPGILEQIPNLSSG